jgi:hypothetical protein
MALRVLDGNQTATTLSSVVTGGEHIVAHSVVSLGANAIANIASAVSGSVVSISNFPASQTIAGTVTANIFGLDQNLGTYNQIPVIGFDTGIEAANLGNVVPVQISNTSGVIGQGNPLPISGTVTANVVGYDYENQVELRIPVSDGAGTVLASIMDFRGSTIVPISGTVTVGASSVTFNSNVAKRDDGSWTNLGVETGSGYVKARVYPSDVAPFTATVTVGNSVTIGSLPAISGTVTVGMLTAENSANAFPNQQSPVQLKANSSDGSLRTRLEYVAGAFSDTSVVAYKSPSIEAGSVVTYAYLRTHVNNSVTIGSLPTLAPQLPRVTFIDGSGTVTTANSAITVFASSTTRSYLLVQVTTGSAFVNVGATATTVNGISLTAGQGYAWETTIPQGLVSLISTTTSSRWVAKEA